MKTVQQHNKSSTKNGIPNEFTDSGSDSYKKCSFPKDLIRDFYTTFEEEI